MSNLKQEIREALKAVITEKMAKEYLIETEGYPKEWDTELKAHINNQVREARIDELNRWKSFEFDFKDPLSVLRTLRDYVDDRLNQLTSDKGGSDG